MIKFFKRKIQKKMKNAFVTILAWVLDKLKGKNGIIFVIVQSVLIAVYAALSQGIASGLIPDGAIFQQGLEFLAVTLMALIGTNTVTDLPDNFDPGNAKEWLAKVLDSMKTNRPTLFAILQTAFLTAFGVLTYGGFALNSTLEIVLQVVTMGAIILTGSRTKKFLLPEQEYQALISEKGGKRNFPLEYYD